MNIQERRSPTGYGFQEPTISKDRISPQNPFGSPDSGESLSKFLSAFHHLTIFEPGVGARWNKFLLKIYFGGLLKFKQRSVNIGVKLSSPPS